jgi:plastocyanin
VLRALPAAFGWRSLTQWSGALAAVLLVGAGLLLGDREAAALAVVAVVGLVLLRFWAGLLILAGIFTATLAFMLPGAFSNLLHGQGLLAYAVPLSLSAVSAAGLVGVIGAVLRPASESGAARGVAAAVSAAFVVALFGGVVAAQAPAQMTANELAISAKTNAFSTSTLTAAPGRVAIRFANKDLFWHTFTIDSIGVNLRVPVNAEEEMSFDVGPGTYEFYCAIPGHALIGMRGTLVVQ